MSQSLQLQHAPVAVSQRRPHLLRRLLIGAALLLLACWIVDLGFQMREWTWRTTEPIRWKSNIMNAWRWGNLVAESGDTEALTYPAVLANCFLFYDRVEESRPRGDALDYPPLRLLIATLWVQYTHERVPAANDWLPEYSGPMLMLNSICTLAAAVTAMLLVRLWYSRQQARRSRSGWALGTIAAMLIWFNPAIILESHGWPQWDIWPVPFYLLAALLASKQYWAPAGILLAIGCMMKGQMLLVAPVFLLWPLLGRQWAAAVRILLGFAAGTILVTCPWHVRGLWAWGTLAGLAVLPAAVLLIMRRWRWAGYAFLAGLVLGIAAGFWFGGYSLSWYRIGLLTGTTKHEAMYRNFAANLPLILSAKFGLSLHDPVRMGSATLELRQFLVACLGITLLLCGWAAARHARRNDPRVLAALVAPWVLMYTLLGQMDGRYLLYGVATSALLVAIRPELVLICVVLTAINFASMLRFMLQMRRGMALQLRANLDALIPGMSWVLLVIAGVVLYLALTRGSSRPSATCSHPGCAD